MFINEMDLRLDIKTWMESYAIAYCRQASIEITKMAENAINQFYRDYGPNNGKPWYYNRTEDLLKNSYAPYYHNNGTRVYGGVRISADKMKDYRNGRSFTPAEKVAEWTWKKGYHGYYNHDPAQAIYTFPPVAMVQMAMGDKNFLNDLRAHGEKIATQQKYSLLKF